MNILVFAPRYAYENDISTSFIHNQLKEFNKEGHSVKVIIPLPLGKKTANNHMKVIDGVEIYYHNYISFSNFGEKYGINEFSFMISYVFSKKCKKNFKPDVIYLQTLSCCTMAANIIKKLHKCKTTITIHGSDLMGFYNKKQNCIIKRRLKSIDIITCVSHKLGEVIKEICVDFKPIVIINGFRKYSNHEYEKKECTIVQVSSLIPQKSVHTTIHAFSKVLNSYPNANLSIVGEGPEKGKLMELCCSLGINDKVKFLGFLDNEKTQQIMAQSQFFVMPSTNEGFGIVYLEAMNNGCVTIGTEGEGISFFIENGVDGFLVPPGDSDQIAKIIVNCLDNHDYMNKISNSGKSKVNQMSWNENARKYLKIFFEGKL